MEDKKVIHSESVATENSKATRYFGSLKPHGKVLGNNIFTFHLPNLEELANTLNSFPKPVFWITSDNFLMSPLVKNVLGIHNVIVISEEKTKQLYPVLNLHELQDFLTTKANLNAMILISCNEVDTEKYSALIDDIISTNKKYAN